jgi:hypothetical protein
VSRALLADVNALRARASQRNDLRRDQAVIDDRVGAFDQLERFERQELGITRTRADQRDAARSAASTVDARDLKLIKLIPVSDLAGKTSRVSAVYDAAPRESFIVALKDIRELWELPYGGKTGPVYQGLVHDYRMGEALAAEGPLPVRRIALDDILDDFYFDPAYDHLIGAARDGHTGQVVNLNVRRKIAEVDLPGLPHLGSGITWTWHDRPVLATPNLKQGLVTVIDMKSWKTVVQVNRGARILPAQP